MLAPPPLILIADRDAAIRDALQFSLELEGLIVHTHNSVADLLANPKLLMASCVVADERMPDMDGIELLRHFENNNIGVPVILTTNHATDQLQVRAAAAGARLVLEKPFLNNGLTSNVLRIVRAEI